MQDSSSQQMADRGVLMVINVVVVFEDGHERPMKQHANLIDAVDYALLLADKYGTQSGNGHGPADFVQIKIDGRIELSIKIFAGGLL